MINKNIISILICSYVVRCSYVYEHDLEQLSNCHYILMIYCLIDMYNCRKFDMRLHHIATIMIGYVLYKTVLLDPTNIVLSKTTSILMKTEISTIPLTILHMGYKNIFIKTLFVLIFLYVRTYSVTYYLVIKRDTCFYCYDNSHPIYNVCENNNLCMFSWVFSTSILILLNNYWTVLMMLRYIK
jgi:hypothetical protein